MVGQLYLVGIVLSLVSKKVPQPVAKIGSKEILQRLVAQIPWGHNILLMEKVKDLPTRLWYMQKTIEQGWGRNGIGEQARKACPGF